MAKQWDYPKWQRFFRETENLDNAYELFYQEAGITFTPITLMQNGKVTVPQFKPLKDYALCDLILKRYNKGAMLVVGFSTGHFPFRMGLLYPFTVDALDCYRKSVVAAQTAQAMLPADLALKFSFHQGVAENLSGYQNYDVIVNFCLEHVRDPKHVIAETLQHLNVDGAAYFTPPIGHGTDSPTHLSHFQEENLRALFPAEYTVNVYRTRFTKDSPRDNCFIIEAYRK